MLCQSDQHNDVCTKDIVLAALIGARANVALLYCHRATANLCGCNLLLRMLETIVHAFLGSFTF